MPVSTLTKRGQTTVPKEVRDLLKLKPNDEIIYDIQGDEVRLLTARKILDEISGSFPLKKGEKPLNFKKLRKEFQETGAKKVLERMKR